MPLPTRIVHEYSYGNYCCRSAAKRVGSQSSWTEIYNDMRIGSPGAVSFKPASHRQSMDDLESPSQLKVSQSPLLTSDVPSQTGSIHQLLIPGPSVKASDERDVWTLPRSFRSPQKTLVQNVGKPDMPKYRCGYITFLLSFILSRHLFVS